MRQGTLDTTAPQKRVLWYTFNMVWPFSLFEKSKSPVVPVVMIPNTSPDAPTLGHAPKEVETRYKREGWWLEHRVGLRRFGVGVLIAIEVAAALAGLWAFADYFLLDYVEEQRLVGSFFEGAGDLRLVTDRKSTRLNS